MKLMRTSAVALAAALAVGCGGDNGNGPTGVTIADLVGTWTATTWEYQDASNATLKENVVVFGFGATVTIAADGSYTGTLTVPDPSLLLCGTALCNVPFSGSIAITSDMLTLNFDALLDLGAIVLDPADPPLFDLTLDPAGSQLTLFGTDFTWDFLADDPIGDIPANLTIVFARN